MPVDSSHPAPDRPGFRHPAQVERCFLHASRMKPPHPQPLNEGEAAGAEVSPGLGDSPMFGSFLHRTPRDESTWLGSPNCRPCPRVVFAVAHGEATDFAGAPRLPIGPVAYDRVAPAAQGLGGQHRIRRQGIRLVERGH
jgi:hypothetical protein